MSTHSFVLQGEFTDLNTYINAERSNRFMGAKIKREETERVMWSLTKAPKLKGKFYMRFCWYSKNSRKDPDNIAFAKKFILDGMVKIGMIENDTQEFIIGLSDSFYVDKLRPRVVVSLYSYPFGDPTDR